ncbi:hypothetical protein, partial [Fusobacterium necrophorum]|uniref:hypothetical protein n=4 Tax=Fusobacterium necrophorum TaxID=859 RepID=UPI0011C2374F
MSATVICSKGDIAAGAATFMFGAVGVTRVLGVGGVTLGACTVILGTSGALTCEKRTSFGVTEGGETAFSWIAFGEILAPKSTESTNS